MTMDHNAYPESCSDHISTWKLHFLKLKKVARGSDVMNEVGFHIEEVIFDYRSYLIGSGTTMRRVRLKEKTGLQVPQ